MYNHGSMRTGCAASSHSLDVNTVSYYMNNEQVSVQSFCYLTANNVGATVLQQLCFVPCDKSSVKPKLWPLVRQFLYVNYLALRYVKV